LPKLIIIALPNGLYEIPKKFKGIIIFCVK